MFRHNSSGGASQDTGASTKRSKAAATAAAVKKSKGRTDVSAPKPPNNRPDSEPRGRALQHLDPCIVVNALTALYNAWDLLHVWVSEETLDDRIMGSFGPLASVISVLTNCLGALMVSSDTGLLPRIQEKKELYIDALERVTERAALSGDVLKTIIASKALPKSEEKSELSMDWAASCLVSLSGCIEIQSKLYE
jgi:hypothetical protein